jgi:hypothetical protein
MSKLSHGPGCRAIKEQRKAPQKAQRELSRRQKEQELKCVGPKAAPIGPVLTRRRFPPPYPLHC